jgi:hypothetical protein
MRCESFVPRLRKRIGIGILMALALTSLSGCLGDNRGVDVRPIAPECSDAGHHQARALAATLGAPSATTEAFDLCLTRWDTPSLYGQLVGVRIDPFLTGGTMRQAETALAKRFACGNPVHTPGSLRGWAESVDCTVGDVHAEVHLIRENQWRISANVYLRP